VRAFVTGATGFVGSHLVEALRAAGHDVVVLARNPAKAGRVFGDQPPTVVTGDLSDREALHAGMEGAEVVFHVAGLVAARRRADLYAINAEATARVADAARETGSVRRFVHVSSLAAAGPTSRDVPLVGTEPASPVTEYGRSKLAAERALQERDLPWVIVRPPAVYGPRDQEFYKMFRLARLGVTPVFGDGSQQLSLIYAEDLARALVAGAEAPAHHIYYAAHPEIVTSRALVEAVHAAVRPARGAPFILPIPGPIARAALWVTGTAAYVRGAATVLSADKADEFLAEAWTCSPDRLAQATGWTPTVDLRAGVTHTFEWYRAHGWL